MLLPLQCTMFAITLAAFLARVIETNLQYEHEICFEITVAEGGALILP